MLKKTTRFLSEWVTTNKTLRDQIDRLRKAYDALDKYCEHLLSRIDHLEGENEKLKEDRWKSPPTA